MCWSGAISDKASMAHTVCANNGYHGVKKKKKIFTRKPTVRWKVVANENTLFCTACADSALNICTPQLTIDAPSLFNNRGVRAQRPSPFSFEHLELSTCFQSSTCSESLLKNSQACAQCAAQSQRKLEEQTYRAFFIHSLSNCYKRNVQDTHYTINHNFCVVGRHSLRYPSSFFEKA